jgi:hypothetical protein
MRLRSAGFRFNKFLRQWKGRALYAEAEMRAAAHSGMTRRFAVPALQQPPVAEASQ